jgi:hypothetical protein
LKGALLLKLWGGDDARATKDIDMLARDTSNDLESMTEIVQRVIATEVEDDGLSFNPKSVAAEGIAEDSDYGGVIIKFTGNLGNARINMQLDIGFGDIVYPGPEESELPSMLNFPHTKMFCYSRESVIAEKLEAIVTLGDANSRMKDFYDIYILSRQFDFDGTKLAKAIQLTFNNRKTELPKEIASFRKEFIDLKNSHWKAFRRKLDQEHVPESFKEVIDHVVRFIIPVTTAILSKSESQLAWLASESWS